MQNPFEMIFTSKRRVQNGIMWIDLDLLFSIRETSYQYFGCFIVLFDKTFSTDYVVFASVWMDPWPRSPVALYS